MKDRYPQLWLTTLLLVFSLQGCTTKLVADYDAQIADEIITVFKQVDSFYGNLLEMPYAERSYAKLKHSYVEIEVNIRALLMQHKARSLNDESISIAETTLELWLKYKEKHKTNWDKYQLSSNKEKIAAKNIYKDALINNHRTRFTRLFTAMSVAEQAKL